MSGSLALGKWQPPHCYCVEVFLRKEKSQSRDLEPSGRTPGRKCFWYWAVRDGQGWLGKGKGSLVSAGGRSRRALTAAPATLEEALLIPSLARLRPKPAPSLVVRDKDFCIQVLSYLHVDNYSTKD